MEILPPVIKLPEEPFQRQHSPDRTDNYPDYKPCLRWEFGFICPFCFIPANNYTWHGPEGGYQMSVEHRNPQSTNGPHIHNYENCYYSCMFCNNSRSNLPIVNEEGDHLLAPDQVGWGDHFEYDGFELKPKTEDARYTLESYDLNDPRKVKIRWFRKKKLSNLLKYFNGVMEKFKRLNEKLHELEDTYQKLEILELLQSVREEKKVAKEEIKHFFQTIPIDITDECNCDSVLDLDLPPVVDEQTITVEID